MKIPGLTITDPEAFAKWLDEQHGHSVDCAANNEGLFCCLDKLAQGESE